MTSSALYYIMGTMNFKFYNDKFSENGFSYFTIDNYFTNDEMQIIGPELESFLPKLQTDVSRANNDRSSKGVFLPDNLKYNKIARKWSDPNEVELERYTESHISYRYLQNLLFETRLLNYYEDQDFYDTHTDWSVYTMVVMLAKTPLKFTGGDLELKDIHKTIEFKNNRVVFFPSYAKHKVTPVKMSVEDHGKGMGRFSITHFLYIPVDEKTIPTTNQSTIDNHGKI